MKSVQVAAVGIIIALIFAILSFGRDLIIPMVLAVFIWYLINIVTDGIAKVQIGKFTFPRWLAFIIGLVCIFGSLAFLTGLISKSVNNVIRSAPTYQSNVQKLIEKGAEVLGMEKSPQLNQLLGQIDFSGFLQDVGLTVAGFVGSAGIIIVYILFIFLEQKCFLPKIDSMLSEETQRKKIRFILQRIYEDTKTYIGIKTFTSLLTGLVSYAIMRMVDLDLALFWALLIFLFNFIPTIGSIIATFFPSVLALVQFPSLVPFVIVTVGVSLTQVVVGNIIEPKMMGNTLNLSPLVILASLALWGTIWGIPGAILCVPLTVLLAIIFSNFTPTRPIAVMLSKEGNIRSEST
jgi:predicted PurR-regulated permease PerM